MKLWQTYSSEHSARVKIIGTFETPDDATRAAALFNRLLETQEASPEFELASAWTEIAEICRQSNLEGFLPSDAPQLRAFRAVSPGGTEIRVEAGSTDIQALLKVLIHYGARIELVSRPPSCAE
jgi:hypothetical protein